LASNRKATFGPVLTVPKPDHAVCDLLKAVRHRLRMDVAWLARAEGELMVIEALDGDDVSFGVRPGATLRNAATYYPQVMTGDVPEIIRDVRAHSTVRRLPAILALRAGSYASAPVFEQDGAYYGMLSAVAHDARPHLQERDARFLRLAAEMMTESVSDLRRLWKGRRVFWDRISAIIDAGGPAMVFQPIANLRAGGRIVGVEALARFPAFGDLYPPGAAADDLGPSAAAFADAVRPGRGRAEPRPRGPTAAGLAEPERWFQCAAAVGLGVELELAAVRSALAQLWRVPPELFLSVNVSPGTIGQDLVDLIQDVEPSRLLLEVTEHDRLEEGSEALKVLGDVRARGVRIGADDVGSGYAGLAQFLTLRPDLVKMDRFLTHGIDSDPARQVIAGALIQIADQIGASVLAEGIESRAELATVRAARIELAQGNHIARPGHQGPRRGTPVPGSIRAPTAPLWTPPPPRDGRRGRARIDQDLRKVPSLIVLVHASGLRRGAPAER
jgi:EAL domain-containing protein (putative c-di-GMP-specific phosphodiesterase class I)